MTDTLAEHADPTLHAGEPLVLAVANAPQGDGVASLTDFIEHAAVADVEAIASIGQ